MLSTEIFFFHFSVKLSSLQLKLLVALYSCDHPQLTAGRPGPNPYINDIIHYSFKIFLRF